QRAQAYLDLTRESPATHDLRERAEKVARGQLAPEEEAALATELDTVGPPARSLAWLAFWDILVFFGVLLVGYAYLWRRGDLVWVRSTAAEQVGAEPPPRPSAPTAPVPERTLVAAGH